ncbi:MAG: bifunctional oligoribonuclease/PAP phosphatase NrnA [Planctomycetes bacterium]|nr:bifunctional oligoribonuclease/PAP phosphatase NrnA [Planctomycetota bacterium]
MRALTHTIRPTSKRMVGKILEFIRRHDRFLCSGHIRSDGDALGAQLALNFLLRKMGKRSHVVCDHGAMEELRFLPGADKVGADPSALRPPYTAVFTCDSGSWQRLERISAALDREAITVVNIDHHASNERFGDINWIDSSYSSTGEMIWTLAKASGVKLDRAIAMNCYTAIVTDTGRFSFSNTTIETHLNAAECMRVGVRPADVTRLLFRQKSPGHWKMAACLIRDMKMSEDGRVAWISITPALVREAGFEPAETQDFMDILKSIKGVDVAILFRPQDGRVKVSWRTDPGIDGIALASQWGGGGHPRASGASIEGSMEDVERLVIQQTLDLLRDGGGAA